MSDTYRDKAKAKVKKFNWKNWTPEAEKLLREYAGWHFYASCPKAWNKMFHTRPLRRREKKVLKEIDLNNRGEEVSFQSYKKPHHYYW